MSGPALFKLGDTTINLAGTSASIGGMTSIGTSIIKSVNDINGLTLNSGTSHHFITNGTEKMTITPGGSVGIGTDAPSSLLEVATTTVGDVIKCGVAAMGNRITSSNYAFFGHEDTNTSTKYALAQGSAGDTFINASSSAQIAFRINNADVGRFNSSGNFGIGSSNPGTYKLEVTGDAGKSAGGTAWKSISDDRIKYNEVLLSGPSALAAIIQLNPQTYEKIIEIPLGVSGTWIPTDAEWPYVKDNYVWDNEIGVIAQTVRSIPGLSAGVTGQEVNAEGTQTPLWLNWDYIHSYHVAATKELNNQLESEKAKVADLLARVTALENP